MTFISASITNAAPGPLLYAAMETALLGVGYTLVDTVVISTRTHKILKSPAGSNSFGKDWYLDVTYNTTGVTDGLWIRTFEDYTPASDLGIRGPGLGNYVVSYDFDEPTWSWGGSTGYALETNWSIYGSRLSLTTSAFTYWISITPDRVIVMLSTATTSLMYAGFYQPTDFFEEQAGAASFPLFCGVIGNGSIASYGFLTRIPYVLDGPEVGTADSDMSVNVSSYLMGRWFAQNFVTTADPTNFWFYISFPVQLVKALDSNYASSVLGELIDVRYTRGNSSGTQVQGDTCSVTTNPALTGGDTYVLTNRNTHIFMFRNI